MQPFSRRRALSLLAAPAFAAPQTTASTSSGGSDADVFSISRNQPAATFEDTLPVGNGTLGASVFGAIDRERLVLNECTLWSGEPKDWNNPGAKAVLPEVRRLLFAGKFKEAEQLCLQMQGPYTQSYLPMGDLHVRFEHGVPNRAQVWAEGANGLAQGSYLRYSRKLDLKSAIATVTYQFGGVEYRREVFA